MQLKRRFCFHSLPVYSTERFTKSIYRTHRVAACGVMERSGGEPRCAANCGTEKTKSIRLPQFVQVERGSAIAGYPLMPIKGVFYNSVLGSLLREIFDTR